ncbi:HugZ family pyridoxamine 5'-phosphate oxidase [Aminobacter sp. HY435]|uniref:HugZ family pyridoxamine 5'-phosphate oxidase n=1 Tax=Aminobacter sp. HY435 TaxID=2970917 RepID=UPI0022B9A011|nr:HugZ family protein [Aminobacter sp. HY435]
MEERKKDVIRETDAEAIKLARTLMRTARHGALAVIEPETGSPLASRVGTATDTDGTPLILISGLSAHTKGIIADPRCSLLVGEIGKGDPLAHARITLFCKARKLERGTPEYARAERRYINRNPKAKLYIGLTDFTVFRLELERANLNGGFGKAYLLTGEELLLSGPAVETVAGAEQGALEHMNSDHREAIDIYANHYGKLGGKGWTLSGFDPEGMDLALGDETARVAFPAMLLEAADLRKSLVEMAKEGRAAKS